jgi:hypothetical protein
VRGAAEPFFIGKNFNGTAFVRTLWLSFSPGLPPSILNSAAGIVIALLAIIIILIRWVVRALRALFRGAERELV